MKIKTKTDLIFFLFPSVWQIVTNDFLSFNEIERVVMTSKRVKTDSKFKP